MQETNKPNHRKFRLGVLQWATLILLVLLVIGIPLTGRTGHGTTRIFLIGFLVLGFPILFTYTFFWPLVRRLLWRVRSQLLMNYFLVGILPIVLFYLLFSIGFNLVIGQAGSYLMRQELDRRTEQVYFKAEGLARSAVRGESFVEPSGFDEGAVIKSAGTVSAIPLAGPISEFPAWSNDGFQGIVRNKAGKYFFAAGASANSGERQANVFAYESLDDQSLAEMLKGLGGAQIVEGDQIQFRIGSFRAPTAKLMVNSENTAPVPASRGFWDNALSNGSPFEVYRLENGTRAEEAIIVDTRTALVLSRLFSTLGGASFIPVILMLILAAALLAVEGGAILSSIQLTRSITRTVHALYAGTKKIESGDFSHRVPIRASDQLSALAESFNVMTGRIEQLIQEVKEKEKLESELEIARQVQSQLFPREAPKLLTLELAGICNPARVVSGDYYDFIAVGSGAAVIIGDISGKGISAALLMASVQASLHAQLAMSEGSEMSTATLVGRLNKQLYENTPSEKYATFFCGLYDDRTGRLRYTNAGHLAPVLIRNGEVSRLESNGTVVGLFPACPYEEVAVDLQPGDLFAAFTDGLSEPENSAEEQFGEDRVAALLMEHGDKPLEAIARIVIDVVLRWTHDPDKQDDITILLARRIQAGSAS